MSKKLLRWSIQILILTGVLFAVSIFSLCIGSSGIPLKKIFLTIFEGRGSAEYSIIFDIRLPRIILGFAVGGSLSLAGVILQGLFRNPLVEPYTLGISGGAAMGVCLNIVLGIYHISILSLPVSGFAGAILVVLIVYFLTLKKGILKIQGLLLTGVMLSFISSSLIMFIMAVSKAEDLHGIIFWIMGSLEEPSMFLIKITVLLSVLGLFGTYLFCHDLNAFALGEENASHLGVDTEKTKKALFLLSSLLTGCAVSVAGVIGFVGLVIPHFVRMFIGYDHRILILASFLTGGAFLIVCDTIARTVIAPIELPVGVITGIIGGIMFIYFLNKR